MMLRLEDVSKRFGGLTAVDGCSYTVRQGEITCLIGPNGAGKTTSFNLISGMQRPDTGRILFEGTPIGGLPPRRIARLGIGRTFQTPREMDDFSVAESIAMAPLNDAMEHLSAAFLRPGAVRRREAQLDAVAADVLADVGLSAKRDTPVSALSGGQKKLLELARAIAFGARLILLDEPTAGVNPALIEQLTALLRRRRHAGLTFLIVEHNMAFVSDIADHVIVMAEGRTLVDGPFDTVRRHPQVAEAYLGAAG